jgi:hypothetical protein
MHRVPTGHCWNPAPHTHCPNALHESARAASHITQFVPFGPHAVTVRVV